MSIRANAGIRMKDENRSKAGRKRDRIGGKSEIRANAGIRVNNENRSKAKKEAGVRGEMEISVCVENEKTEKYGDQIRRGNFGTVRHDGFGAVQHKGLPERDGRFGKVRAQKARTGLA